MTIATGKELSQTAQDLATDKSFEKIAETAEKLLRPNVASKTLSDYESRWKQWLIFCENHQKQAVPAHPSVIVAWIAAMSNEGRSIVTIRQSLAALRHKHLESGTENPCLHPDVKLAVSNAARLYGRPRRPKKALTLDALKTILPQGRGLRPVRDKAMIALGWFAALRRSEIVALCWKDLLFSEEGVSLHITRSKTDQRSEGTHRGVFYQSDPKLCPVRALLVWKLTCETECVSGGTVLSGPLFRYITRSQKITDRAPHPCWVAATLKRHCVRAGIDPKEFAGHSLRRGFATEASKQGKRIEAIQHHLRHESISTTQKYMEEGRVFDASNPSMGIA